MEQIHPSVSRRVRRFDEAGAGTRRAWGVMRRRGISLLSFAVLGTAFGCSSDKGDGRNDAGPAHAPAGPDAAVPNESGTPSGGAGAAGSSGGASSGSGGNGASSGHESRDAAADRASFAQDAAPPLDGEDSSVPVAGTPVRGNVNGSSFEGVDQYSLVDMQDGMSLLRVAIVNFADSCSAQLSTVRSGAFHQSSAGAYLAIVVPGSGVPPGTYKVNASSITSPFLIAPDPTVFAGYAHNNDQCAEVDLDALSGTIVVEQLDDQHVTGAFDVTFANGHLSGAFDAPRCDELLRAGPADAGSGGCFP